MKEQNTVHVRCIESQNKDLKASLQALKVNLTLEHQMKENQLVEEFRVDIDELQS